MGWHVSGESESMNTANGNIPNHMVWTIVSTVIATLTCCPLGLLGIPMLEHAPHDVLQVHQADDVVGVPAHDGDA